MPLPIRRLAILALAVGGTASPLAAQHGSIAVDASIGLSSNSQRHAVSAWYTVASAWDRVSLDVGLRATSYGGDAGLYNNRGTISATFPNTLSISPGVVGLNAAVQTSVRLIGPVSAGFNLDLGGVASGASRTLGSLTATVQTGSLFLGGAADLGALNSETYVAVRLTNRFALRGGTSHYVTNYAVTDPATPGAPAIRYQKFVTVPFVAVAFRF